MAGKRDLSGFGEAPAKAQPTKHTEPATSQQPPLVPPPTTRPTPIETLPAEVKAQSPATAKQSKKQRVTLSLPTSVAAMLRKTADREQRIFLDLILTAFVAHADDIDTHFVERRVATGLAATGGRRRADAGRTQIPLNILVEDLLVLDARRAAHNMDRSAYVTELLVRELKR